MSQTPETQQAERNTAKQAQPAQEISMITKQEVNALLSHAEIIATFRANPSPELEVMLRRNLSHWIASERLETLWTLFIVTGAFDRVLTTGARANTNTNATSTAKQPSAASQRYNDSQVSPDEQLNAKTGGQ